MNDDFVPIILGSDINAYGMARAIHEEYAKKSLVITSFSLAPTRFSHIVNVTIIKEFNLEEVFIETLINFGKDAQNLSSKKYVLIPCGDNYALFIAKYSEELSQYFEFSTISKCLAEYITDKNNFYQLCKKHHIPHPSTIYVTKEELRRWYFAKSLPFEYPMILKATDSIQWKKTYFEGKQKAHFVESEETMIDLIKQIDLCSYRGDFVIQEYIPGDASYMRVLNAYVDQFGQIRMMFLGQPLLEDPSPEQIGNYMAILPAFEKDIYEQVTRFLKATNYRGFANFDIKYDEKTQTFKFLEINIRQGRSSYFVTLNGFNLAKYLIDDLIYKTPYIKTHIGNLDKSGYLWLGVAKRDLKRFTIENDVKKTALDLIKRKHVGTTLHYKYDMTLKRLFLIHYINYNFSKNLKDFFDGSINH